MSVTAATNEKREFRTEVRKVLDIVINSLYTERDIFLRELISNSADALEKMRHQELVSEEGEVFDHHVPLEISIDCDKKGKKLTITDTGIGMTAAELENNLGTIAYSGSRAFLENLAESGKKEDLSLIGQFGVGFYSAFMVAAKVTVQSRSWRRDEEGHQWESDGVANYTISPCPGIRRGTKIILELKEGEEKYADPLTIKRIIKQYSAFVPFPIKVDGETVNTVQAIWTRNPSEISEDEHRDFYRYLGNVGGEPLTRLHFTTDAPLAIHALLYVPGENLERFGLGRMDPGVSLYCRKVLIDQHSKHLLPEWLRFLKGVVDSEDLPLNISRQALQDNLLVGKIRRIITSRFIKHLKELGEKEPETYKKVWETFGVFFKEGVASDPAWENDLAALLRFESSATEPGELTSLADYVSRMKEDQKEIFFIGGASREDIENGPYLEVFRKKGFEVLYTTEPIDDFVLSRLGEYDGRKITSCERADIGIEAGDGEGKEAMAEDEVKALAAWLKETLGDRVGEVRASKRLVDSPAILVNPTGFMTAGMERIMRASQPEEGGGFSRRDLEINPAHDIIRGLDRFRRKDEDLARTMAGQLLDAAMIQAGIPVQGRDMVERSLELIEKVVRGIGG